MGNPKGPLVVLQEFFGRKPGQDLKAFRDEVAQLSDEEKLSMAQDAAKVMGLTQEEVIFQMK